MRRLLSLVFCVSVLCVCGAGCQVEKKDITKKAEPVARPSQAPVIPPEAKNVPRPIY